MSLVNIIKNQDFFKKIVEKKEKNALANALMFFCDDEETSKNVLILTAMLLQYPTFDLFDENSAEFLKILNGADLDNRIYPKNGEKLLVADSNEIVYEAYIKPVNFQNKIFIIHDFDVSTEEAQNKLLKVLEEPPKNVYFLLSAKSENKVLPTIKSRCDKIKISPLDDETLALVCKDPIACVLGGGYIGKTIFLEKNENLKSICDFAVSIFTHMKTSKDVLKFSKDFLFFKEEIDLILEVMLMCDEDIIKIKCESENLCKLKSYADKLKSVQGEFTISALCEIEKQISLFRQKIEYNANLTALVDNFLLKILEVKYLCK